MSTIYLWPLEATESLANAAVTHLQHDVLKDELNVNNLPEQLDGFVYCPGSINLRPFRGLKPTTFQEDFNLNVVGAVKCLQTVLPLLQKSEQASIVFYSTIGCEHGYAIHASVAAAKGALEIDSFIGRRIRSMFRVNVLPRH